MQHWYCSGTEWVPYLCHIGLGLHCHSTSAAVASDYYSRSTSVVLVRRGASVPVQPAERYQNIASVSPDPSPEPHVGAKLRTTPAPGLTPLPGGPSIDPLGADTLALSSLARFL